MSSRVGFTFYDRGKDCLQNQVAFNVNLMAKCWPAASWNQLRNHPLSLPLSLFPTKCLALSSTDHPTKCHTHWVKHCPEVGIPTWIFHGGQPTPTRLWSWTGVCLKGEDIICLGFSLKENALWEQAWQRWMPRLRSTMLWFPEAAEGEGLHWG